MIDQMVVIETPIPEDVYQVLEAKGLAHEDLAQQSSRLLALRLYQDHVLSLGHAARLAGLSRWEFISVLSQNQVPVIDYDDDELRAEFSTVDRLTEELEDK